MFWNLHGMVEAAGGIRTTSHRRKMAVREQLLASACGGGALDQAKWRRRGIRPLRRTLRSCSEQTTVA